MAQLGQFASELQAQNLTLSGPIAWVSLAKQQGLTGDTANWISLDHEESLKSRHPDLHAKGWMVLRVGQGQFVLALGSSGVGSFFLADREIFGSEDYETFVPRTPIEDYLPITLLETAGGLTEATAVLMAAATGLLGHALAVDQPEAPVFPVRAGGVHTFAFRVRPDGPVVHHKGQVEVDGVFMARRSGKPVIFVVEAKLVGAATTIARHKLLYSALVVRNRVPADLDVVPVYLKYDPSHQSYSLCECRPVGAGEPVLEQIAPVGRAGRYRLWTPGARTAP